MIDASNKEPILRTSNGVAKSTCTRKTQPAKIGDLTLSVSSRKLIDWPSLDRSGRVFQKSIIRASFVTAPGYWHANYAARLVDNPFWVAFTASEGIRKSVSEPVGRIIRNELRIDNRSITSCAIAA